MRFTICVLLFLFAVIALSTEAWADSALVGASYKCDKNKFSLYASVESTEGNIPSPPNMQAMVVGENKLRCHIDKSVIETNVYLSGPGQNGLCGDPGTIYINGLKIDGAQIIETEPMLLYCEPKPTITNLDIKKSKKSLAFLICKGQWN